MFKENLNNKILPFISTIVLMLLLSWLTVSIPYVYEAKQQIAKTAFVDSNNPFAGTTEEKTPASPTVNINEEFLHGNDYDFSLQSGQISMAYILAHEPAYIAFHGEILCPPPNQS